MSHVCSALCGITIQQSCQDTDGGSPGLEFDDALEGRLASAQERVRLYEALSLHVVLYGGFSNFQRNSNSANLIQFRLIGGSSSSYSGCDGSCTMAHRRSTRSAQRHVTIPYTITFNSQLRKGQYGKVPLVSRSNDSENERDISSSSTDQPKDQGLSHQPGAFSAKGLRPTKWKLVF
eukprot:6299992-Amphidinium_carterae.2